MNNFLEIFQQTFWQILGKIVTTFSTFIILGTVARNYGEKGTGLFTLVLTYLSIFYLLSDFGFNAHVLKKVTGYRLQVTDEWQKLLGTRIIWSVALAGLAIGLLPFWPFATNDFSKAVLFSSLAIIGSSVFISCNLIFQGKLRYDLSVLALSLGTIISLGLFSYLSLQKYPIPFLLLAHLSGWVIIAAISLFLMKKFLPKISPIFDYQYAKALFKDSWPIAATLALNVVYFRIDSFMIAYFNSISDVGIYNVAYSVFQSALVLPTFIMNSYYPLMLKSLRGLKLVALALTGIASLGTILTIILAPFILMLLTGKGFSGSASSLQILSLGFPAFFLSSLFMWFLITKGKYKKMLIIYTSGLIINFFLNIIFIPRYSYFAASWTTVISEYMILGMQAVVLLLP